jgi:antirestriction protein
VLTDDEADQRWEDSLDSYLDDCILPELPDMAQAYFDSEAWKRDARIDGRAHSISHYDGEEYEVGDFIIIREN